MGTHEWPAHACGYFCCVYAFSTCSHRIGNAGIHKSAACSLSHIAQLIFSLAVRISLLINFA
jgi:hypothetical protein